jgi:hypothetical protein
LTSQYCTISVRNRILLLSVFNRHKWITDQAGSPEVLNDIFGVQLFEFFYLSAQLSFLLFQWQTLTFFFFFFPYHVFLLDSVMCMMTCMPSVHKLKISLTQSRKLKIKMHKHAYTIRYRILSSISLPMDQVI